MMTVLKNKNVLLVEDNDEFAQNFMTLLSLFVGAIFHCKDIGSAQKVLVDEKIDMIVMGNRGLGVLGGLLMGSVSTEVVQIAKCPVVIVK